MAETISQPLSKWSHKSKFKTVLSFSVLNASQLSISCSCFLSKQKAAFFLLLHRLFCSISILLDSLLLQAFAWGGKYVSVDMGHSHKYFHVHDSAVWKCVQALILYHAHSLCGFVTVVYLHLSHFDFVYLCKPLYCVIVFYYYIWIGMLLYRECLSTFQSFCMVLKGLPWRVILFKPRQSVVSYM